MTQHLLNMKEKSTSRSKAARLAGNAILQNRNHSKAKIKEAFSHFAESAAYALPGSEELALAYNNRSVLSHHIRMYDLALIDINEALSIDTVTILLKVKLLIRKINCLKSIGDKVELLQVQEVQNLLNKIESSESKRQMTEALKKALEVKGDINFRAFMSKPFPKMTGSTEIPCASDAVEIKYNKTFGRHLAVNRYVPPGEILIAEDAYVTFPILENRYLYCCHCLNLALCAIPCDSCSLLIFCSKLCKNNAWKKYHNFECSIMKTLVDQTLFETSIFLLCRSVIVGLKEQDFKINTEYVVNEHKSIEKNPGYIISH